MSEKHKIIDSENSRREPDSIECHIVANMVANTANSSAQEICDPTATAEPLKLKEAIDYRLWFSFIRDRRWSRTQKTKLLDYFGDLGAIYAATERSIDQIIGTKRRSRKPNIDQNAVLKELAWLESSNHDLITYFDARYPAALREVNDPPVALYAVGNLTLLDQPKVAIVGSRKPSPIGAKVAAQISTSLSELGVAIVSGLALGVDAVAHEASLSVGGPSIAVVGCGIDVVYPARHKRLHEKMYQNGLVLSEYPMGFKPNRYTFPDRNRLVSGLSSGVVIVEAAERSGTLITARLAIEQNRELMVVPGPALSPQYAGSHRLIKDGAALVCKGQDVVELLFCELSDYCAGMGLSASSNSGSTACPSQSTYGDTVRLSDIQQRVFDVIDYESASIDAVIDKTALSSEQVSMVLLELELNAMVATTLEGGYIRAN